MQFTATGFFVARMAGTPHRAALELGLVGAARAVPVLLLSPLAGVVADRLPRRRVLVVTNVTIAFTALARALLATTHRLDLSSLIIISAIYAAAFAFDSPTRQSWVPFLVDRQYVGNAVGLNSVAFNAPAVIGPRSRVCSSCGSASPERFIAIAVATLAVVAAVLMMRPSPLIGRRRCNASRCCA